MLSGFYTAGSGILNGQREINVIGNNISNSQTAGYRTQKL
ncbi:MAG: flagellar biosynthesis protein FlgG, partial [Oscillospiraceae bacterium]|nr:flagellar biosynthesis protein FlgG [Oscillospiraceae bacterium]